MHWKDNWPSRSELPSLEDVMLHGARSDHKTYFILRHWGLDNDDVERIRVMISRRGWGRRVNYFSINKICKVLVEEGWVKRGMLSCKLNITKAA